jgi:osmotically-inducible protein OsmY
MPSNNRYENQRGRGEDRGQDYSGQQGSGQQAGSQSGYRSGQMSQFEDTGRSSQSGWSTGEDYPSRRQMGGSSEAGYSRYDPPSFEDRDEDDYRYGQSQFERSQSGGDDAQRYSHGSNYGDEPFGRSRNFGGSTRSRDYDMGSGSSGSRDYGRGSTYRSSSYGSSAGSYGGYPSGFSGEYRRPRDQWSQNDYDGRDVSRPFGASYSRQSSGEDFGSWREYGERRGFFDRASDEIASWFGDEDAARRREQDHRGRGPTSYTRSDERIKEDANEQLTRDWRIDATHITVSVIDGEVTLDGHVPNRDAKRRAEDCVEDISGVKHVQNNLRVHNISSTPTQGGYTGASTGASGHNLTSTSTSTGTGNATTGVGTTAPGATGSTGSTGASNKT